MNDAKYIGLDVHQATISAAVLDSVGKLLMESTFETKAATILQFLDGLRGSLHGLPKAGKKGDRIDARKLADLLRTGLLTAVYHGEHSVRTLKELARSYLALTQDLTRVMNRLNATWRLKHFLTLCGT